MTHLVLPSSVFWFHPQAGNGEMSTVVLDTGHLETYEASSRLFLLSLWSILGHLLILEAISDSGGMLNIEYLSPGA